MARLQNAVKFPSILLVPKLANFHQHAVVEGTFAVRVMDNGFWMMWTKHRVYLVFFSQPSSSLPRLILMFKHLSTSSSSHCRAPRYLFLFLWPSSSLPCFSHCRVPHYLVLFSRSSTSLPRPLLTVEHLATSFSSRGSHSSFRVKVRVLSRLPHITELLQRQMK